MKPQSVAHARAKTAAPEPAQGELSRISELTGYLKKLLDAIFPEEVWDDGSAETARRVVDYWMAMMPCEEVEFKFTTFPAGSIKQMIIVKDIEFVSLCAHHLLPFYGRAHVAYLPQDKMIGVSKIPRLVDFYATRPQTQERMTEQIASHLKHGLNAMGVGVVIEATHTCMACRGVHKPDAIMITNEMRGVFLTDPSPRNEFLTSIARSKDGGR